jgi:hypothetical protein
MIEIKKKIGNVQLITDTFDLIDLSVNFTNLSSNPYTFGTNYPNKIFIPVSTTLKYYSVGTQSGGFYISNINISGISNSFYNIFQSGVIPDQSGIVTLGQWGADVTSYGNNDDSSTQLKLFTNVNELTASYIVFTLSITYYLINTL